jgi:hypothetical protein
MKYKKKINETELVLWKYKQDWQTLNQTNQRKEKTQTNKIRDKKGDLTIDNTEFQRIVS